MDQNQQKPRPETAVGTAVVFIIVLISALLMMRFDSSGCHADWTCGKARDPGLATLPVSPL
jgi:hypothetical protein